MYRILLILLIGTTHLLHAQESMISIITQLSKKYDIVQGVDETLTYEYSTFSTSGALEPDTVLFINEEQQSLYLNNIVSYKYPAPLERLDTHSKPDGAVSHTIHTKYSPNGNVIYQNTDYGESAAAALLNSKVEYVFDKEGRITSVVNNGEEYIRIKYKEGSKEFILDQFSMNAGVANLEATSSQIGDTLRYDMHMVMGEEFAALMGDQKMPKEHMDLVFENDLQCYFHYKEDAQTKGMDLQSVFMFNNEMLPIEVKQKDYATSGMSHFTYDYDESGNVITKINMLDNTKLEWQYDRVGNVLLEYDDSSQTIHQYDGRGNVVQSISSDLHSGSLSTLKLMSHQYKNSSPKSVSDEK